MHSKFPLISCRSELTLMLALMALFNGCRDKWLSCIYYHFNLILFHDFKFLLELTTLTACLQLHVHICVGVNMDTCKCEQTISNLLMVRNAVCVGCGTSVLHCDQKGNYSTLWILWKIRGNWKQRILKLEMKK